MRRARRCRWPRCVNTASTDARSSTVRCSTAKKDFDYYRAYWAKNLYWFECWETTGYGRENNNPIYAGRSRIIALLPPDFGGFSLRPTDVRTSDDGRFWAAPESLTTE